MRTTSRNAYANYRHLPARAWAVSRWGEPARAWVGWGVGWGDHLRPSTTDTPSVTYPVYPDPDLIIDHGRQVVLDVRRDVQAEPKLVIELTADEKDVVIQCRCGDRISLVKLLGLETVSPIFEGISGRIRGLIENMKPEVDKK